MLTLTVLILSSCGMPTIATPLPPEPIIFISFVSDKSEPISSENLSLAQKILQARFGSILPGKSEVKVVDNTLRVGLLEEKDLSIAVELATNRGEVNFIDSDKPLPVGTSIASNPTIIITDTDVAHGTISPVSTTQTWIVDITLTSEGQRKLHEYTRSQLS